MKNLVSVMLFVGCIVNNLFAMSPVPNLFSLTTTSTWREFQQQQALQSTQKPSNNKLDFIDQADKSKASTPERAPKKKDKWVLVGEIKLKSKDTLFINDIKARWNGGNLGGTFASLYSKKLTDRRLPVPIEENLICDGAWNPATKEFIFPVNKKLVASDTYYLMLNVPATHETLLRAGSFEIIQHKKRAMLRLKK